MTSLGTIGSGNIGSTVARLAVAAGHDVVLSNSRGPDTLRELAAEIGARAGTTADAAAADVVLVTVPLEVYPDLDPELLAGKVVLDTMNYYPQRDGQIAELDDKRSTTSGLLQAHAPQAKVVKAFNNIYFKHLLNLARPEGDPERSPLLIAGDDESAKALAGSFIGSLGYDVLDTGSLAESWRFERDRPAYAAAYGTFENEAGAPITAERLQELLDEAVR
ncbi:NADP oxidoreductase [Nocardioides mangrovicus]|uniref:NADP oxidoreductase n=2 Tax=Nocardioides mangrovicus TaxID=2478913 RepID=A0A3L8NXK1_9ACTN|nr:NADP oxidoreductase [Nocardioides mangrovicus]